jgi:hypothetical protein
VTPRYPGRAKGLFCATEECDRVWESTGLHGETSVSVPWCAGGGGGAGGEGARAVAGARG